MSLADTGPAISDFRALGTRISLRQKSETSKPSHLEFKPPQHSGNPGARRNLRATLTFQRTLREHMTTSATLRLDSRCALQSAAVQLASLSSRPVQVTNAMPEEIPTSMFCGLPVMAATEPTLAAVTSATR